MRVLLHCSPRSYFEEQLLLCSQKQEFKPSPGSLNYISGVLADFIQAEMLFVENNGKKTSETMALLYHQALQAESPIKARETFRRMGDLSMVMSGFFPDQFNRKIVDIDYFMGMGETAYKEVSTRVTKSDVKTLFHHLSVDFTRHVNLLSEVSYQSFASKDGDILRTYEKWLKTKSTFLEERLKEKGIHPIDQDDTSFKQ